MTVAPTRETGRRPAPPETARAGARDTGSGRDGAAGGVASFRVREGGLAGGLGPAAEFGLAAELDPARMDAEWALLAADVEAEWARFFASPEEVSAARGDVDDLVGAEVMRQVRLAWDAADRMDSAGGIGAADGINTAVGSSVGSGVGSPGLREQLACLTGFRALLAGIDGLDAASAGAGAGAAALDLPSVARDLPSTVPAGVPGDPPSASGYGVIGEGVMGPGAAGAGLGGDVDAVRVDVLAALEALAGAVAAAQARVTVAFADSQVDGAAGRGASVVEAERGVAPQVGLARGLSASAAEKRVALARSLTSVLPHTMAALTGGRIGEAHALAVHAGSRCLSPEFRRVLDQRIAADLGTCTPRRLRKLVDRIAAELDAAAVAARHADAVRSRAVWTRPAPDGMCYLTILGPVHQIVGAYASVRGYATRVVAGHGAEEAEGRSLSQVMTDTALARLAGLAVGEAQPVTVNLVMTPESLYGHARNPYPSDPTNAASDADDRAGRGALGVADPPAGYAWADPSTTTAITAAAGGPPVKTPNPAPAVPSWSTTKPPNAASTTAIVGATTEAAKPEPTACEGPRHALGGGDRCAGVNTPARIVGHGHVPAAVARAWLLAGCDDHTDSETTAIADAIQTTVGDLTAVAGGATGRQHPGDHHSQPDHAEPDHPPGDSRARVNDHQARPSPAVEVIPCKPAREAADLETGAARTQQAGPHETRPRETRPVRVGADDWQTQWNATPPPTATAQAAEVWVRRAFTSPDGRDLVALETKARLFPPALRSLLILRDDTCRMPYCDAQIGHADHITPWTDGGTTTLTNGQGLSIRCNYTKDLAGFATRVLTRAEVAAYADHLSSDPGDPGEPSDHGPPEPTILGRWITLRHRNTLVARAAGPDTHVTELRTPTGHVYLSAAPPASG